MRRGLWVVVAVLGVVVSALYMAGVAPPAWLYLLRSVLRLVGVML